MFFLSVITISFAIADKLPTVSILTPIKNAKDILPFYFYKLLSLDYPLDKISVCFEEGDSDVSSEDFIKKIISLHKTGNIEEINTYSGYEWQTMRYLLKRLPSTTNSFEQINKIEYYKKNRSIKHFSKKVSHRDRHELSVQKKRRRVLAIARNSLIEKCVGPEVDVVLWLDVDAIGFDNAILRNLLIRQSRSPGPFVMAPHITWGGNRLTYDRNSWFELNMNFLNNADVSECAGQAIFEGYEHEREIDDKCYQSIGHRLYLDDFSNKFGGDKYETVPLHGVGTAFLLVSAQIHRDFHINFPTTLYKRRIESEAFGLKCAFYEDKRINIIGLPNYFIEHLETSNLEEYFYPTKDLTRNYLTKKLIPYNDIHNIHFQRLLKGEPDLDLYIEEIFPNNSTSNMSDLTQTQMATTTTTTTTTTPAPTTIVTKNITRAVIKQTVDLSFSVDSCTGTSAECFATNKLAIESSIGAFVTDVVVANKASSSKTCKFLVTSKNLLNDFSTCDAQGQDCDVCLNYFVCLRGIGGNCPTVRRVLNIGPKRSLAAAIDVEVEYAAAASATAIETTANDVFGASSATTAISTSDTTQLNTLTTQLNQSGVSAQSTTVNSATNQETTSQSGNAPVIVIVISTVTPPSLSAISTSLWGLVWIFCVFFN